MLFQVYNKVIQLYTHTYIYIYILFQISFYYRLLRGIEYGSLCYTAGPCYLPILYVLVTQSCPALCDPMNCRPPGSSVHSPGKNIGVGCHFLLQFYM